MSVEMRRTTPQPGPRFRSPFEVLRTQLELRRCAEVGRGVQVRGEVWVHGEGRVLVGSHVSFDARECPVELHAMRQGTIEICDDVSLEAGVSIESQALVRVGRGCRLGRFCKIMDTHFHATRGDHRARPAPSPVVLEDGVVIGDRAILLPGAFLAAGAQVRPGAVVTRRMAR